MTAGVPVELKTQAPQTLLFARDASVGAVVATTPLTDCQDLQQLVGEVVRVLQPGGTFVFLQRLTNGGALQRLVGDVQSSVGASTSKPHPPACLTVAASDAGALEAALEAWEDAFDRIEIDVCLQGVDSHVVGVATRAAVAARNDSDVVQGEQLLKRRAGKSRQ